LRYEFIAAMFWLMRIPMVLSSWKTAAGVAAGGVVRPAFLAGRGPHRLQNGAVEEFLGTFSAIFRYAGCATALAVRGTGTLTRVRKSERLAMAA
jgi:hypothetical protein